jgi:hypothetical protein
VAQRLPFFEESSCYNPQPLTRTFLIGGPIPVFSVPAGANSYGKEPFMTTLTYSQKTSWTVLIVIFALAAILLLVAPEEKELGSGIRSVYVHVALTWTGMTGIVIAGFVGLASAVFNRPRLQSWAYIITWVALVSFSAGLVMSIIAAGINWGGVFWQEPRTNAVLTIVAAGLIVQGLSTWPVNHRSKGSLNFLLAVALLWLILTTPLVLHPGNAARTSNSFAIRFTFFGLYGLCMLAAAWFVQFIQRRIE